MSKETGIRERLQEIADVAEETINRLVALYEKQTGEPMSPVMNMELFGALAVEIMKVRDALGQPGGINARLP